MEHLQIHTEIATKTARRYSTAGAVSLIIGVIATVVYAACKLNFSDPSLSPYVEELAAFTAAIFNSLTALSLLSAGRDLAKIATDRWTIQREIERKDLWLEAIVRQMPVGIGVLTVPDGDLALANNKYFDLFKIEHALKHAAELRAGMRAFNEKGERCDPRSWPSRRAMFGGETVIDEELLIERGDGELVWMSISAAPITDRSGEQAVVVTFADIGDRKQAEHERARLLRGILTAQEEERLRIARELHDELGQDLTVLSIGLKGLEIGAAPAFKEALQEHRRNVEAMSVHVRVLIAKLRPLMLEDFGLKHALQELALSWGDRLQAEVHLDLDEAVGASGDSSDIVVYRFVQEALTNVAKHADASSITVKTEKINSMISITVADNGNGFETDLVKTFSGRHGLAGMAERLATLGGSLDIHSSTGAGTTVQAKIPYEGGHSNGNASAMQDFSGR
jgi:signal transduction histidine kinase